MSVDQVLRLPLSGFQLEWREHDHHWRATRHPEDEFELTEDERRDRDLEWAAWTGDTSSVAGEAGTYDGQPTIWILYGQLPTTNNVAVLLADGSRPAIHILGRVWATEWISLPQQAHVLTASGTIEVPFDDQRRMTPGL